MPDVFISYARSTETQARAATQALRALGYDVWRDDDLPSHRAYADVIEERLQSAAAVLVIWSADAVKSQWVRSEADRARGEGKLVQLTLDASRLPMPFDQIQCADLGGWTGEGQHPNWGKVISSLSELLGASSGPAAQAAASVAPPPATAAEPILAVLPFDNLSTDPEMQFFSDGVSEDIIQRLSRGADIKVIGRTSSFQFQGARKAEAAAALNCSHVLDGSVRRAGARVRITAHLVEAVTQTTQWSDRYDRGLEDVFAVQDEISEQIAAALHETFTSFCTKAVDPAVYDLYLRASPRSYGADELRAAIAALESATRRSPHFAEAWGRLAYVRAFLRFFQPFVQRPAIATQVRAEAGRALAIDPHNGDALAALYLVVAPFGDFIAADAAMQRLREAPGVSDGLRFISWHLQGVGFVKESAEEAERLYRLDALNPFFVNAYAGSLLAVERFEEAIALIEEVVERQPNMLFAVGNLLIARAYLKDWDGVEAMLSPTALASRPLPPGMVWCFREVLEIARHPGPESVVRARAILEQEFNQNGSVQILSLGLVARLGLVDEVYRIALTGRLGPRGADDDHMGQDYYRPSMLFSGAHRELRNDPRFVELCARFGLVEFWLASGNWPDCADETPYDFRAACEAARSIPKAPFGF